MPRVRGRGELAVRQGAVVGRSTHAHGTCQRGLGGASDRPCRRAAGTFSLPNRGVVVLNPD